MQKNSYFLIFFENFRVILHAKAYYFFNFRALAKKKVASDLLRFGSQFQGRDFLFRGPKHVVRNQTDGRAKSTKTHFSHERLALRSLQNIWQNTHGVTRANPVSILFESFSCGSSTIKRAFDILWVCTLTGAEIQNPLVENVHPSMVFRTP